MLVSLKAITVVKSLDVKLIVESPQPIKIRYPPIISTPKKIL
jgi:hypothetical protein